MIFAGISAPYARLRVDPTELGNDSDRTSTR